ncbi:hypothetical protein [Peribacillus kribbensis]|uniref:hypothetical protein n=1 Tax=Peribacillus kribbensis TaxID=356658 RepID=UPI0004110C65|nr:hypothetical protein [Peribacillus kribbensis]
MTYEEIVTLIQYDQKESKVFIPNEIFQDLQNSIHKKIHIPVAYSYYYLINWLYRHAKFGSHTIDNKKIKKILGYNSETKGIDYLCKKDGLLDELGYTETVKDIPLSWQFDDDNGLEFTMLSEMEEDVQLIITKNLSRKYSIKFPVKAFYRYDNEVMDGTFYEFHNTHMIPFEVFLFCMSNKDIGCTGFYLYSFIKMKNQQHNGKFDCSMQELAVLTGIPSTTMKDSLSMLRQYSVIEGIHNQDFFCLVLEDGKRKANSYIANDIDLFTDQPVPYEKIQRLEIKQYFKMQEVKWKETRKDWADVPLEMLPY